MNKPFTEKQVRERLLTHIAKMCQWWAKETHITSTQEKLEGLAFSILVALDGGATDLPQFIVAPNPHPDNKAVNIADGDDYYPENHKSVKQVACNLGGTLHDQWYDIVEKI